MIFERQSEIVYVLRQFGDSVRKPVPLPLPKRHPDFSDFDTNSCCQEDIEPDLVIPEDPLFAAHQSGAPYLLRV